MPLRRVMNRLLQRKNETIISQMTLTTYATDFRPDLANTVSENVSSQCLAMFA